MTGYEHDEIVHDLGDGWSIAWDTTKIDAETRAAVDAAIERNVERMIAALTKGEA